METLRNYTKVLIGYNDNEPIYLSPPSWDCGWYWGFGYLGNRNCHYHIDGLNKKINLHDAIKEHFGSTLNVRNSDLWVLAELFKSFYTLKETAYILEKGSAHLATNPCKDIVINSKESERINKTVLPSIFDEIYKILDRNQDNKKLFKSLVNLNLKGDTSKVIEFMNKNSIKTDDLKTIEDNDNYNHEYIDGLSSHDFNVIHTAYWKDYHSNKK